MVKQAGAFWSGERDWGRRAATSLSSCSPVIGLVGALIAWNSEIMLLVIALSYLVSGVLARLAYGWGRTATAVASNGCGVSGSFQECWA